MEHYCKQVKSFDGINVEVAVLKEETKAIRGETSDLKAQIREIRDDLKKMNWWMIGTLTTSLLSLVGILLRK